MGHIAPTRPSGSIEADRVGEARKEGGVPCVRELVADSLSLSLEEGKKAHEFSFGSAQDDARGKE
jgi:hypothetical protein